MTGRLKRHYVAVDQRDGNGAAVFQLDPNLGGYWGHSYSLWQDDLSTIRAVENRNRHECARDAALEGPPRRGCPTSGRVMTLLRIRSWSSSWTDGGKVCVTCGAIRGGG